MKIESIKCDRCGSEIPDGPPNSWYKIVYTVMWTMQNAPAEYDLCINCDNAFLLFMQNTPLAVNIK